MTTKPGLKKAQASMESSYKTYILPNGSSITSFHEYLYFLLTGYTGLDKTIQAQRIVQSS
jgi:hypothetical protein